MAGLLNATLFLFNIFFTAYIWILTLRVLLQWFKADPYNPISQIVAQITRIPVSNLQRVFPRWRRLDVAAILYALLISWVYVQVVMSFLDQSVGTSRGLWLAVRELVQQVLNLYSASLFIYILLSWFGPGVTNPVGSVLWSINEPLLRPVRRIIPPQAGLDFSALIVLLSLQVASIILGST